MAPPSFSAPLLLSLLLLLGAVLTAVHAQEDTGANSKTITRSIVWSAIAFVNHGETTPFLLSANPVLTPAGAQQLYRQGAAFRSRYLAPSSGNASAATAPIQGLAQNAIDNTQLRLLSQTDAWVAGGALAFLQGLYPPDAGAFNAAAGGEVMAENLAGSNATTIMSYPLDGYQYPQIETLPQTDMSSVGIQGNVGCPTWQNASTTNLTTIPALKDAAQQNADFYTKLFSTAPLQGVIDASDANYFNAYDIYNLVRYEYTHNETVFSSLADANATLAKLAANAFTMQRAKCDPGSSTSNDTASVTLSIAGRTLARQVATQMAYNANRTADQSRQMTLMFGSFQPLVALFSVAGLLSRDNILSTPMGNVTAPGAAIVFELIGEDPDDNSRFPKTDDLSVRFLYRPTADEGDAFQVFSLFGSGFDGSTIPYSSFLEQMNSRGRDAVQWCQVCKAGPTSSWCADVTSSGSSCQSGTRSQMNPALAGVIGALIMGAIIGLVVLGLCGLGGFRFQRRGKGAGGVGFRGAEKKPSDQDVRYGGGGDAQERIGSWEMRGGQPARAGAEGNSGQYLSTHEQRNPFDDDAGSDVGGATPAKVHESF